MLLFLHLFLSQAVLDIFSVLEVVKKRLGFIFYFYLNLVSLACNFRYLDDTKAFFIQDI